MKRALLFLISASLLVLPLAPTAHAQGTVTQGGWSLTYPDFSTLPTDTEWKFTLTGSGTAPNVILSGDDLELSVLDSRGTELASDTSFNFGSTVRSATFEPYLFKSTIYSADLTSPLTAKITIDRGFGSSLADVSLSFTIPVTTFPKRPAAMADFVTLQPDFASPVPYPKECTDLFFTYTVRDPYEDIEDLTFSIVDSTGKSIASAFVYGYGSTPVKEDISLCPYSLDEAKAPLTLQTEIKFKSTLNRAPLVSQVPFEVEAKFAAVDKLVNAMSKVCKKGSQFRVAKSCAGGFSEVNFIKPTTLQWNTLTRSANSMKGKSFLVYGCVAQFDTNTGGGKFRGYVLPEPAERYYSGTNSLLSGAAKSLLKLSENDAFAAKVTVLGSTTYSTIGGRTGVPNLQIRDYVKIGTC
jgi:hypothetical protein